MPCRCKLKAVCVQNADCLQLTAARHCVGSGAEQEPREFYSAPFFVRGTAIVIPAAYQRWGEVDETEKSSR